LLLRPPPRPALFPYTTLFRSLTGADLTRRAVAQARRFGVEILTPQEVRKVRVDDPYRIVTLADGSELSCHALLLATGVSYRKLEDRKSTRLNSSHVSISYAVF